MSIPDSCSRPPDKFSKPVHSLSNNSLQIVLRLAYYRSWANVTKINIEPFFFKSQQHTTIWCKVALFSPPFTIILNWLQTIVTDQNPVSFVTNEDVVWAHFYFFGFWKCKTFNIFWGPQLNNQTAEEVIRKNKQKNNQTFTHHQSSVVKGSWQPGSRSSRRRRRLVWRVPLENPVLLAAIAEEFQAKKTIWNVNANLCFGFTVLKWFRPWVNQDYNTSMDLRQRC